VPIEALFSGLGLAGAAGLNAYVPLLLVGMFGRFGWIHLAAPFDTLTSWWAILMIGFLLLIEVVVDKIPGVDHLNDLLQTIIRPAAGAILFASSTGVITSVHPSVSLLSGLILAFSVHATKAAARPVVSASTAGVGAPIVSFLEDLAALGTSLVAIFLPLLIGVALLGFVALGVWVWSAFRKLRRTKQVPKP
jgi:Domain of unknown function (DUF4126)